MLQKGRSVFAARYLCRRQSHKRGTRDLATRFGAAQTNLAVAVSSNSRSRQLLLPFAASLQSARNNRDL